MKKFFYPKSLAVVGVSGFPDNLARGIVANLLEFNYQGKIFLVGRRPGIAFGLPILPSLRELPGPVALAALSQLMAQFPQIREVGINLVFPRRPGLLARDARIRLG